MGYLKFIKQDWPLLGFGLLMTALSGPGQTFFVGLFRDPITAHFGISIGDFGLIFSTATLVSAAVFFWSGKLIDRWHVTYVTTVFTLLYAVSAALVGLAPHVAILAIGIFGIRHLGQSLMSHISATTMARFFNHNRAKAIGLASIGHAASEAIFPISMVTLLGLVGWRITWALVAGLIAFGFLPLARWLLRATTRDLSLDQQVPQTGSSAATEQVERPADDTRQWTRSEVARDIRFWLILPAVMSSPYLLTGMFFHQASLGQEYGLSLEVIAGCFTSFAIAAMLGSLIIGPIVDRRGYLTLYPICFFLMSLAIFILSQSDGLLGALTFYALSGFAIGLVIPVSGALWPGLYGVRHLGAIRSMVSSITVLATGLAPASFGYLLDAGVTLKQIAFWGAIYSFATVALLLVFVLFEKQKQALR